MTSTPGSTPQSAEPVRRVAVVTHGRAERSSRLATRARSRRAGVELLFAARRREARVERRRRRARPRRRPRRRRHDAARAPPASSARDVPVLGVNFGRVGFLTSIPRGRAGGGPRRAFAGELESSSCRRSPSRSTARRHVAVNDVVATSSTLGRMVELDWAVGGEDLGTLPCDGIICCGALGLDRLQPLERRPGARLGPRRDGDHVHRAALPARPAARRSGRTARSSIRNRTPTCAPPCSSTGTPPPRSATGPERVRAARRAAQPCSRCCPSRCSSAATARPLPVVERLRIENLVLIREAELDARPGAERDHRRDRRRQDDPGAGDRHAARRARRRARRSGRPGRGLRRGGARPAGRAARRGGPRASSPSCGPRARRRSCSRAASSPTGGHAPTPGGAAWPARTWPPRPSA